MDTVNGKSLDLCSHSFTIITIVCLYHWHCCYRATFISFRFWSPSPWFFGLSVGIYSGHWLTQLDVRCTLLGKTDRFKCCFTRLMFRSEVLHWSLCNFSITLVLTIGGISLCGQKYKTIRLISNLIKQIICCHLIVVLRQVIWTAVAANLIWIRSIKCGKLLTVSNQI